VAPRPSPVVLGRRDAGLRERAAGHDSALRRLDWVLALAVAALIGMGSLLVWSATRQRMLDADLDPAAFLKRHLVNAAIGLALASLAA
jgi:rod shape determining protein RodA